MCQLSLCYYMKNAYIIQVEFNWVGKNVGLCENWRADPGLSEKPQNVPGTACGEGMDICDPHESYRNGADEVEPAGFGRSCKCVTGKHG